MHDMHLQSQNQAEEAEDVMDHSIASIEAAIESSRGTNADINDVFADCATLTAGVRRAEEFENAMTTRKAIFGFAFASLASLLVTFSCATEGYSLVLTPGFFAVRRFLADYGECTSTASGTTCVLPASTQVGMIDGNMAGQLVGTFLAGWAVDEHGYRSVFQRALFYMFVFTFITFFSDGCIIKYMLGLILSGIPWGIFQIIAPSYASDLCFRKARPIILAVINLDWIFGQLAASVVLFGTQRLDSPLAYKVPLGLQFVLPVLIFIFSFFVPESPAWLIRKGERAAAQKALERLGSYHKCDEYDVKDHMALLVETDRREKENNGEGNGYVHLFRREHLRRTLITCGVWATQNFCGQALLQFSTVTFLQAGLSHDMAFALTIYALGIIGTLISFHLLTILRRRTLYLSGLIGGLVFLLAIGIIASLSIASKTQGLIIGILLLLFAFSYNLSIGPVTYPLLSELPSTRLRAKTISLARVCYLAVSLFNGGVTPLMLAPTAWDWGAQSAFFWCGTSVVCLAFVYWYVPETKGRTSGEVDELFHRGVGARESVAWNLEAGREQEMDDRGEKRGGGVEVRDVTGRP